MPPLAQTESENNNHHQSPRSELIEAIASVVLNSDEINSQTLRSISQILNAVKPSSLLPGGIPSEEVATQWQNPVQYYEIADHEDFSVAIFLIQKGGSIPIHDHPNMNVVSRLLFGELEEKSFDWEDESDPTSQGSVEDSVEFQSKAKQGLAIVTKSEVRDTKETECAVIQPKNGNLHEVTATATCAFLDCFVPPYDPASEDFKSTFSNWNPLGCLFL